jgi:hypothetical protein
MTFEAIMDAEMKSWWSDELQAIGNLAFSHCSETRDAKVTDKCSLVRCGVEAMKYGNFIFNPEDVGGYSGHANKWVMN